MPVPENEERRHLVSCLMPMLTDLDVDDRALLQRIDLESRVDTELATDFGQCLRGRKLRVP